MTAFDLPSQTVVNKVIPKNAFDKYTTSRQKKKLSELVERIRWTNKLSPETINLSGKDVREIQIFEVQLRKWEDVDDLLDAFDKAIPYPIVFLAFYGDKAFVSTSQKHIHLTNENISVIDWRFKTGKLKKSDTGIAFDLKKSLDYVFHSICSQLSSGLSTSSGSLNELVAFERELSVLHQKIEKLKASIKRTTQFNKKVELNQELKRLESKLSRLEFTT